jgi:threonine/homoserine/homoserine lactone efflux protein
LEQTHPKYLFYAFWLGMGISFIGSLPLGTLNIAAMQIAIAEGVKNGIYFSIGSLLIEMIYVRISLIGMEWMLKQEKAVRILEWASIAIVLLLAIFSFYNASISSANSEPIKFIPWMHRLALGFFMSAINPVQIPFWFGWSTVLFERKLLVQKNLHYWIYILGIGTGTLLGNMVFIFGGKYMAAKIANNQAYLNYAIGTVFLLTALFQIFKQYKKRLKSPV